MKKHPIITESQPSFKAYIVGFILSLILTLIPYFIVIYHWVNANFLLPTILIFAMLQLVVQLLFFLHLGRETKPRWKLVIFISFISIIIIIVGGSLWIMQHLNYSMSMFQLNNLMNYGEGF